jgi:hypothetical protein
VIPSLRARFNGQMFSEDVHQKLLAALNEEVGEKILFRVCETPVFVPRELLAEMKQGALELIAQLNTPAYREASKQAIPAKYRAPNDQERPNFMQVDFAVTRDPSGAYVPKLVELQAWPSIYAFQLLLPQAFKRHYDLGDLAYLLDGMTDEEYIALLRRTVLGKHSTEEVILMEIEPERQKTRPDFLMTERYLGIPTVGISDIRKRGKQLTYRAKNGREIEIRRIYNRAIVEELEARQVPCDFDLRDELEVEWAGHPNWFFRISKYSIPFLDHKTVPKAWFLDQLPQIPQDLENFVLKPLFSFAGAGVKVNVTREDIDAIPDGARGNFLLQQKIQYHPTIPTLDDPSKLEVRMMILWPDDEAEPQVVTTLPRLSKGLLLGVDFNKNRTWVGSACCLFEP